MNTKQLGDHGEELAAAFLEAQGYVVLARNYRYERAEVDLVCFKPADTYTDGGDLVFAEVKTRSSRAFGAPEAAVDEEKRRHLIRAAKAYLYEHKLEGAPCRFDVLSILLPPGGPPQIEHFEDAFWVL